MTISAEQVIDAVYRGLSHKGVRNSLNVTKSVLYNALKKEGLTISEIIRHYNNGKPKETLLQKVHEAVAASPEQSHPMINRRCIIRTYSAGVHIGDVVYIDGMECKLENALRLWKWEGSGLSLSAVANNGIKKGRLNKTGEVYLTNVIEFIPTTKEAEETYVKFIED